MPLSPPGKKESAPAVRLRIRSRFHPVMELWRHPVRLTVSLLLTFFLLPEAAMIGTKTADLPVLISYVLGAVFVFLLVIAPQFFVASLNCRHVTYDFFDDHLCFTENILLRDKIRIQYKSISGLHIRQASVQKPLHLFDLVIQTRPRGREDMAGTAYIIPDVLSPQRKIQKIEALLQSWRRAQDAPQVSSVSGTAVDTGRDRR